MKQSEILPLKWEKVFGAIYPESKRQIGRGGDVITEGKSS